MNVELENGRGVAVAAGDSLLTKLYLRTHVPRGTLFVSPERGNRFHMVKQATPAGAALLRDLILESVADLRTRGDVVDISCATEVSDYPGQIDFKITAIRPDEKVITYEDFVEVV